MRVEQPRYQNVLQDEFFSAAAAVGLKANDDFNAWDRSQVRRGRTGGLVGQT